MATVTNDMTHSYAELEDSAVWRALEGEVAALEENRDLQLATARPYVVGALCRRLMDAGLVVDGATREAAIAQAEGGRAAQLAAVIVRVLAISIAIPVVAAAVFQVVIYFQGPDSRLTVSGVPPGMVGFLVYFAPAALLWYFSKPMGRWIARGL